MACDFRITECPSSKIARFYSANKDTSWVVAIDLGTAYSGYCYYLKGKTEIRSHCNNDLTSNIKTAKIMNPKWSTNGNVKTLKAPTCILFDEQGKFVAFGYDAQKIYIRKGQSKKHFFENFKMQLYKKEIRRKMKISDSKGRDMEAMKVFSESIRYLKDHALCMVNQTEKIPFSASDVTWVLTVPAIWEPAAKQFMRAAAVQGGLVTETDSSRLIIALEPEAASVWCKQLPIDDFIPELDHEKLEQKPGTQYIVVDCGGGTVDMTVHEVLKDGFLKELHKASGNDMGGGTVDAKFTNLLKDIFGCEFWDKYEKAHPSEVLRIMLDFTTFKCAPFLQDVYIPCSQNLIDLAEETQEISLFFTDVQGVSWSFGDIEISLSKLEELFRESVDKIVQDIRAILHPSKLDISYILLVGGYASCSILQNEVKEQFGSQCSIHCPLDAQLAVAKGAVLFGVTPMIVVSRISALTYGIAVVRTFDEKIHKVEKLRKNKAKVYCDDLFFKFVGNGQSVFCDKAVEYMFVPEDSDQTAMRFRFFSTEKAKALYVDEGGMKEIGEFTVNMPDIRKGLDREVKLEISFGLTEIEATATDMTSNEQESVMLNFMTQ